MILGWIRESRMPLTQANSMARQAITLLVEGGDEYGEADAREWLGRALQLIRKVSGCLMGISKANENHEAPDRIRPG